MDSKWIDITLGDICDKQGGSIRTGPFGSQLHTSDYKEHGTPVVMPTNIDAQGISQEGIARIGQEDLDRLSQHQLEIGDIVFSRRGDVTKNALVRKKESGWLCGTGCLKVRIGREKITNAQFISHYLRAPEIKNWLIQHAVGATMPNLNTAILSAVPVKLPPLQIQYQITGILSAIDDRISLLRETNKTLEAIAQAIFKSWFIDFDPVRAKMEGRQPEGMDEETAVLFPDEFEESELGLLPQGWKITTIGNVIQTEGGGTPSTKNAEYWEPGVVNWTSPRDLSGASSPILLDTERRISQVGLARISSGLLPVGTLLMSSRAPIGYLALTHIPVAINQGYIAMLPDGQLPPMFMYFWCKLNMKTVRNHANGSTFMEISKRSFRNISLVVPCAVVLDRFIELTHPLFDRIAENERQAQTLTTLRDTLLPRLISGRLRLPEAEAFATEACI